MIIIGLGVTGTPSAAVPESWTPRVETNGITQAGKPQDSDHANIGVTGPR